MINVNPGKLYSDYIENEYNKLSIPKIGGNGVLKSIDGFHGSQDTLPGIPK